MNDNEVLSALRKEIDICDTELTSLFCKRMDIVSRVAEYKKEHGLPVLDAARERTLLLKVSNLPEPQYSDAVRVLYSTILSLSRAHQQKQLEVSHAISELVKNAIDCTPKIFPESASVAVQGVEGAYSQIAAGKLFGLPQITFCPTFEDVFSAIANGRCRYGVLPIENSTAGSVGSVYELMHKYRFYITRSLRLKVDHCLLAKPGTTLSDIKEIFSHEQALHQCRQYLSEFPGIKITACANTAEAASYVASTDRHDVAALSSQACAEIYGLAVLASGVQDNGSNYTRFICISSSPEIYPGADKSTVMLSVNNRPGELYDLLSKFFALGVNLTKLESSPIPGKDFEFMFYLDFETPVYSQHLTELLDSLASQNSGFRYLGSYSETI